MYDPLPHFNPPSPSEPTLRAFFPDSLAIDAEGTRAPWEAVVLLPFIDEPALVAATSLIPPTALKPAEAARNKRGEDLLFVFNPLVSVSAPSPIPDVISNLTAAHVSISVFNLPIAAP